MINSKGRDWFRNRLEDFTPQQLQEIITDIPDARTRTNLAELLVKRRYEELKDAIADYQADWEENNPVMYG